MPAPDIAREIKDFGRTLGFTHVGITSADDFTEYGEEVLRREDYAKWADRDYDRHPHRLNLYAASRPRSYFPEARSIICATWGYSRILYPESLTPYVARAYLSRAYTPLEDSEAGLRVKKFRDFLTSLGIRIYDGKYTVPARMACARAGIVTFGKNNFAYTREDGSFNILYTFLVDKELPCDAPTIRRDCPENCRICLDACPTHAILSPGRLHPQGCVLNNNQYPVGRLPRERWDMLGTHIHGCDVCQLACPRNRAVLARASVRDPFLEELSERFDLEKILFLDEDYYRETVYPIMYNYIRDLDIFRRNAAIALGNSGDPRHIPALKRAAREGSEGVREAARWAVEKLECGEDREM